MFFSIIFVILNYELVNMISKRKLTIISIITGAAISLNSFTLNLGSASALSILYDLGYEDISATEFSSYSEYLVDSMITIPCFDNMVPQGLTKVGDYYLISSYDFARIDNSCVYVLNQNNEMVNICDIGNKAHVGGIAYDSVNSLLWVTGEFGNINAYDINEILNNKAATPIYCDVDVGSGLKNYQNIFVNSVSYLTIFENKLYVGNFSLNGLGKVKEYSFNLDDENMPLKLEHSFNVPDKVQGVSFYTYGDEKFIIFSRSYGNNVPSLLQIFKYDENIKDYSDGNLESVVVRMPSMIEQIYYEDTSLYAVYESAAKPYESHNIENKETIDKLNIEEAVKRLVLKKDTNS